MRSALHLGVLLLLLFMPVANAADRAAIQDSQAALTGAIEGVLNDRFGSLRGHYLPGYGYHYAIAATIGPDEDPRVLHAKLEDALQRLVPALQGLEPGDWVSLYVHGAPFMPGYDPEPFELLIRVQWDDPASTESWLDGTPLQ